MKAFLLLAVTATATATGFGMTTLRSALRAGIASGVGVWCTFAIAGSKYDLKFNDFVPLRIGALSLRDGKQRLQALAGG